MEREGWSRLLLPLPRVRAVILLPWVEAAVAAPAPLPVVLAATDDLRQFRCKGILLKKDAPFSFSA